MRRGQGRTWAHDSAGALCPTSELLVRFQRQWRRDLGCTPAAAPPLPPCGERATLHAPAPAEGAPHGKRCLERPSTPTLSAEVGYMRLRPLNIDQTRVNPSSVASGERERTEIEAQLWRASV